MYLDKLGLVTDSDTPSKAWGRKLEHVVAEAFQEEAGVAIRENQRLTTHPYRSWMLATPDWETITGGVVPPRPVELKNYRTSRGWGPSGSDEVPDYCLMQLQWQMEVMGADHGHLAVLIGGSDFRHYRFDRHQVLVGRAVEIAGEFWERVLTRRPPEIDWTDPRTPGLVELLHRPEKGQEIDLPEIHAAWEADEYQGYGEEIKQLERLRDRARGLLIERMGSASVGRLTDGRTIKRKVVEVPEKTKVVGGYSYTDFRISKAKGDHEQRGDGDE